MINRVTLIVLIGSKADITPMLSLTPCPHKTLATALDHQPGKLLGQVEIRREVEGKLQITHSDWPRLSLLINYNYSIHACSVR